MKNQLYVDLTGDFKAADSCRFYFPLTVGVNIKLSFTFSSSPSQYGHSPPFPFSPPLGRFATRTTEFSREERGGPTETLADVPHRQANCFWNATSGGDFQNKTVKEVYKILRENKQGFTSLVFCIHMKLQHVNED